MTETMIAVIGGSGIYDIDGLEGAQWSSVTSPNLIASSVS